MQFNNSQNTNNKIAYNNTKNYKSLMTQQNVDIPINNQRKFYNQILNNNNNIIKNQEIIHMDDQMKYNKIIPYSNNNNHNISQTIKKKNENEIQQKSSHKYKSNKISDINKKPTIDKDIFKQFLLITELEKREKIIKLKDEKEKLKNKNKDLTRNFSSLDIEKEKLKNEKKLFNEEKIKIIKDLRQKEKNLCQKEKDIKNQFEQKKNELQELKLQLKQEQNILNTEKEKINNDFNIKLNQLENEYKNKEILQNENNNINLEKIGKEKEIIKQKEKKINEMQNYYMNVNYNLDLKENELNNKEIELQNKEFNLNNKYNQILEKEQDLENEKNIIKNNQKEKNNFDMITQELANKEKKLKNKEYQLIYMEKALNDKEGEIKNRENNIFNQENILNNKLNEHNNEINNKENEINYKLNELNKKEEHLNMLNKEIEDKNNILKELDNEYNNILKNINIEKLKIENSNNNNLLNDNGQNISEKEKSPLTSTNIIQHNIKTNQNENNNLKYIPENKNDFYDKPNISISSKNKSIPDNDLNQENLGNDLINNDINNNLEKDNQYMPDNNEMIDNNQNKRNEEIENNINKEEEEEEYYDFDDYVANQINSQQIKNENNNNFNSNLNTFGNIPVKEENFDKDEINSPNDIDPNIQLNNNSPIYGNIPVKEEKIDKNNINNDNFNIEQNSLENNNNNIINNNLNDLKEKIYKSVDTMNYNNNIEDLGEIDLNDLHDEDLDIKENSNKNLNSPNSLKKESGLKDFNIDDIKEELFIEDYIPSIGLIKVESPKYINPIIQCFAHIQEISDIIINLHVDQNYQNIYNNSILAKAYRELLINLFLPQKTLNLIKMPYNPKKFINTIRSLNPNFQSNNIKYKEFIDFMISNLHEELNINKKETNSEINMSTNSNKNLEIKNENDSLIDFLKNFTEKNNSVIVKNIFGIIKNTLYCHKCQNSFYNFHCYSYLYFNLSEIIEYKQTKYNDENITLDLYDCLDYFQKAETLIGDRAIFCPNCREQNESTSLKNIYSTKNILIFIFENIKENNLEQNIFDYNELINLRDYVEFKKGEKKSKEKFFLCGVVNFVGDNDNYGKEAFIAFCKMGKNNDWYCYDNENIYPVTFQEIKNNGFPVVLFYHKLLKK